MLPFLLAILIAYCVGILSLSRVETVTTYMVLALMTSFVHLAASYAPGFTLPLNGKWVQRWALASVGFLMASYMFVRAFASEVGQHKKRSQAPFVRSTLRAVPANGAGPLF